MIGAPSILRKQFQVADVEPATAPLETLSSAEFLNKLAQSAVLVYPTPNIRAVAAADFHPLIAAAATAFKQHYPLVISPDMIWLAILQGVAQHVNNHREQLRHRLVHHNTRIELVVDTKLETIPQTESEMRWLTGEFANQILKHVQPDKRALFSARFSTSNPAVEIANAVALMDCFQGYFDYVFMCVCGIPSVILEGSTEDWILLKEQVAALHQSDLELDWWTEHLLPLCDQFVCASRGEVDRAHWNNLLKLVARYGVDDLNGWILKFIPYVRGEDETFSRRNPVFELTDFPDEKAPPMEVYGCTSNMLPTGISQAPVTCMINSQQVPLDFLGGFTCVTQDSETLALRPMIGWAISRGRTIERLIERVRTDHEAGPPIKISAFDMTNRFIRGLRADFARFYTEIDGAVLYTKVGTIRILPFAELRKPCDASDLFDPSQRIGGEAIAARQSRWHKVGGFNGGELTLEGDEDREYKASSCSSLILFAEQVDGPIRYLTGSIPETWPGMRNDADAPQIFEWDGAMDVDAFKPVAKSFAEWLERVVT
jgi:hypothetical protein